MASQNLTGVKKLLHDQGWVLFFISFFTVILATMAIDSWVLDNRSIDVYEGVSAIEGWMWKLITFGMSGSFVLLAFRSMRKFYNNPSEEDPTGSKHQKRLRHRRRFDRWAPRVAAALIVIPAALRLMGVIQSDNVFFPGMLSLELLVLWKLQKPFLKIEQIADPATRKAASAQAMWRLVNQFPLWLVGVVAFHLAILSLPALFGVSLPSDSDMWFPFLYMASFGLGCWMLGAGLAGQPLTTRNPQCSEGEKASDTPSESTRWRRSPMLVSIGAVTSGLVLATSFFSIHTALDRAIASLSTTKGLITFLQANDDFQTGFDVYDGALWPVLQSRMPLSAENRDRLVEEFLHRAGGRSGTFSMIQPGMDDWFKKELGAGPNAQQHLVRALEIVQSTNLQEHDLFHVSTLLEALYATPVATFTPEQFGTLVDFTLTTLASKKHQSILISIGGCDWLTEQSEAGRLSPQQEEQFRAESPHAV